MGKKILLADDSITIQKVIELTFSDEDFDVVTVGNGRLALEKLAEVRPDIVLCDIIMPERDGYEVCEQIKRNPAYAHIPVLLLTGAFEPFDQERAARVGSDGFLAKPFEPETLIAKVKDLLARAPAVVSAPATAPPSIVPFQRPTAPPMPPPRMPSPIAAATAEGPSFIPDEPFGGLADAAFEEEATAPTERAEPPPLAAISAEEAKTLSAPPALGTSAADSVTTVMFRAGDLPWNAPGPVSAAAFVPEPTEFSPEPTEAEEIVVEDSSAGESPAFEEVLEEDLEFGPEGFGAEPEMEAGADAGGATVMFTQEGGALPPLVGGQDSATGPFSALLTHPTSTEAGGEIAPAPPSEPPAMRLGREAGGGEFVTTLPTREPVLRPEPRPAPPAWGAQPASSGTAPVPSPAPERAPESFADVRATAPEPAAPGPPVSEAAEVSVPVDMVEKIAQRVVAQVSEKAVREIAWEVIPDLAEALIKQEIERLKAELQKL